MYIVSLRVLYYDIKYTVIYIHIYYIIVCFVSLPLNSSGGANMASTRTETARNDLDQNGFVSQQPAASSQQAK